MPEDDSLKVTADEVRLAVANARATSDKCDRALDTQIQLIQLKKHNKIRRSEVN